VRLGSERRPRSLTSARALAVFVCISVLKPYGAKMSRGRGPSGGTYQCTTEGCPQKGESVKIVTGAPRTCAACGAAMKKKRIV